MKLHDVGCAANAHGCTRNDADDIALTDQPLFQQTFLRKAGQGVDFLDVHDAARRDTPEEGHAPTSFHFRRKRNDWDERAVAGYQPRGEAAVCEYSDESHVQFTRRVADRLGYRFCDLEPLLAGGPWKFVDTRFRGFDDAGHHADRLDGILACRGFRGKHHGIGAVENRVGHIGSFRTRRARVFGHGFEHLRSGDYGAAEFTRSRDDVLLHHRHLLRIHFHTKVAAGHHYAIRDGEDLLEVLDGLRLFEFYDYRRVFPGAAHQFFSEVHVFGTPYEAGSNVVCTMCQGKTQVQAVFFRECRNMQLHSGQVDSLVFPEDAAVDDLANNLGATCFVDAQLDQAIRKEDAVAGFYLARQGVKG